MILVVDNYDSFTWNLVMLLREAGGEGVEIRVVYSDAFSHDALRAMHPSHVVISPGPGSPADAGVSNALVAAPIAPVLGVCLGHQCLGEQLGAQVVRASEPSHGKTVAVLHDDPLFDGLAQGFTAARYHSLTVDPATVRAPLRVIARSPDGVVMGLRADDRPAVGVQFHPESVLTEGGSLIAQNFLRGKGFAHSSAGLRGG